MTIAVSWVRSAGTIRELYVCADSRLTGYGRWDCAPKLVPLPRGDCAVAFAGSTLYAYPILLQILAVISQHPRIQNRSMDLSDLKGHLLRVVNDMVSKLTELPLEEEPPVQFLFSGWSWRKNDFVSWVLHFDPHISRFTHRPIRGWAGPENEKRFSFIGDHYDEFHAELVRVLRKSNKLEHGGFNMEPFQVVRDLLRSGKYD